uniref:Uncharacterized protein n=1 Tax=Oryza nivara TaxID=4536 RepID=A0A0E0FFU7_ORYNI
MNKEGISMDEALDRILERFELMEANRRQEEKFNQILQKLEEVEARRSKAAEETIAAIRATTAVLKAKSPTTPMAPPTPAPTKCLTECPNNNLTWATASSSHITEDTAPTAAWELGNNKHKGHASCVVTKDSPEVTPTMLVTSATTAAASMELVAAGNAIGATYMNNLDHPKVTHAKCSMSGSGVKRGTEQVVLAFPLMASPVEFTTSLVEPSPPTGLKLGAAICVGDQVPMKCSMKCTESDNKPLMEHPKRNPWPPAWLGWKKWYVSWTAVNYSEMRFYFIPPWPPPLKVGWLALVFSKFGAAHTDMMDIMLHWTDMKPWPPPNQNLRSIMVHLFAWKHWKVSVEVSLFAWNTKQYMNSVLLITVGTKWLIQSAVKDCFLQGKPFKLVDPLELMQVILVLLVRDPDVEMFQIGSYSLQPENYQLTNYLVARLLKQGNLKKVLDGVDHSKNIKKSDVDVGEDNPGNINTAAKMFIDGLGIKEDSEMLCPSAQYIDNWSTKLLDEIRNGCNIYLLVALIDDELNPWCFLIDKRWYDILVLLFFTGATWKVESYALPIKDVIHMVVYFVQPLQGILLQTRQGKIENPVILDITSATQTVKFLLCYKSTIKIHPSCSSMVQISASKFRACGKENICYMLLLLVLNIGDCTSLRSTSYMLHASIACAEYWCLHFSEVVQHAICIGWIINWAILFWMEQAICSPRIILQMPWDPGGGKLFIASGCRLGDKPDSKEGVLLGIGPAALRPNTVSSPILGPSKPNRELERKGCCTLRKRNRTEIKHASAASATTAAAATWFRLNLVDLPLFLYYLSCYYLYCSY